MARLHRYDQSVYLELLRGFGTHWIDETFLGGGAMATSYFSSCLLYECSGEWVYDQSSSGFFIFFRSGGSDTHAGPSPPARSLARSRPSCRAIGGTATHATTRHSASVSRVRNASRWGFKNTTQLWDSSSKVDVHLLGGDAEEYGAIGTANKNIMDEDQVREWHRSIFKGKQIPTGFNLRPITDLVRTPARLAHPRLSSTQNVSLVGTPPCLLRGVVGSSSTTMP